MRPGQELGWEWSGGGAGIGGSQGQEDLGLGSRPALVCLVVLSCEVWRELYQM